MKKKILFVVTKSNFGGAQRYVFDLATHLPDAFVPIVAFGAAPDPIRAPSASNGAGGKPGRLERLLLEKNIRTILVPELVRDINVAGDIRAFFALVRLFRHERPGAVHLSSSKAGGLGALAARIARVPRIVFTVHGLPSDELRGSLQRRLIAGATWLTCLLSHRTIAITNADYARLRKQPFLFKRVVLIHNGIEAPTFETPAEAKKALLSIDEKIPDNILVGAIAELHPNKDLMTAIDAVARVEGAHFVIIGDGEERTKLEAFTREKLPSRAHFLGYVPDAARYLRAFDVFLLTSVKEGLPYVLLEAGNAHVPIVATDIPGVQDVVLHNFTGLLAPARDASAIASALSRLVSDTALQKSLTEEMGKRVLKSFSFEHMLAETAKLYTH